MHSTIRPKSASHHHTLKAAPLAGGKASIGPAFDFEELLRSTTTDAAAAIACLKRLFKTTKGPINCCVLLNSDLGNRAGPQQTSRDSTTLEKFITRNDIPKWGNYFCVSTMKNNKLHHHKDSIEETPALHADIDLKDIIDGIGPEDKDENRRQRLKDDIIRKLMRLKHPPSLIVDSGNGIHAYWKFKEAFVYSEDKDRTEQIDRIEDALKLLCDLVGGDFKVTQPSAVMRLPGTHNSKFGNWRKVVVVEQNEKCYELSDLEEWLGETSPIILRKDKPSAQTAGESNAWLKFAEEHKPPIDIEERLSQMLYMGSGECAVHATQLSVTASMLLAGYDVEEIVELVMDATRAAAGDYGKRWNWNREERNIRRMIADAEKKIAAGKLGANANTGSSSSSSSSTSSSSTSSAGIGHNRKSKKKPFHKTVVEAFFAYLDGLGHDLKIVRDARDVEQLWRYDGNLWRLLQEPKSHLDRELEVVVCGLDANRSSMRVINEARALLLRSPNLHSKDSIKFDAHGMVPIKGFLIDPCALQLTPMRRDHFCTWYIDIEYDAAAKCPHWLKMLDDTFADRTKPERIKQIELLQDFTGISLIDNKPKALRRAAVFFGPSNTGKTSMISVMSGLVAIEPISTSLIDLSGPFGLQEFMGRCAPWVLHEAFDQGTWHLSSRVKSVLSGDVLSINPKGTRACSMPINTVAFWATNHQPKFREMTTSMIERLLVIETRVRFEPGVNVDITKLAKKSNYQKPEDFILATERPGLLNWALLGAQRALERGRFEDTESGKEALEEIRLDSNVAAGFTEECVEYDSRRMLSLPDLYLTFSSYWKEMRGDDHKIPSPDLLGRSISALGNPRIAQDNKKFKDRNGVRFYPGIVLSETGRSHFSSESYILMMGGKLPDRASHKVADTAKPIPETWDDHPQIIRIRKLAKEARKPSKF